MQLKPVSKESIRRNCNGTRPGISMPSGNARLAGAVNGKGWHYKPMLRLLEKMKQLSVKASATFFKTPCCFRKLNQ
jgi:hypothetical protein